MIGKRPLWVSKHHGRRLETMFRADAAWVEGAPESAVAVIREARSRVMDSKYLPTESDS